MFTFVDATTRRTGHVVVPPRLLPRAGPVGQRFTLIPAASGTPPLLRYQIERRRNSTPMPARDGTRTGLASWIRPPG